MNMEDLTIIIIKSIFLIIFITTAVIGNLCVLIAIKTCKKLKTLSNIFVFNLAIADLSFAITGMPMILVTTLAGEWILGGIVCDVEGLLNTLFTTASIWTIVMIGINRYFSVEKATNISKYYTRKRSYVLISLVWMFSFGISIPPLFGWSEFISGSNFCTINGKNDLSYSIFVLTMDYIVPMFLLCGLYCEIFLLLRKHDKVLKKSKRYQYVPPIDNALPIAHYSAEKEKCQSSRNLLEAFGSTIRKRSPSHEMKTAMVKGIANDEIQEHNNDNNAVAEFKVKRKYSFDFNVQVTFPSTVKNGASVIKIIQERGLRLRTLIKEARVTKMLLIVVLAFFICWTPFVVASVLYSFELASSKFQLLTFGIMCGCLNSVINPIIYGAMNRNFRNAFKSMYGSVKGLFSC